MPATIAPKKTKKPATPADSGLAMLKLDLSQMPPNIRRDLEANAQVKRISPAGVLADILNNKLAEFGITFSAQ